MTLEEERAWALYEGYSPDTLCSSWSCLSGSAQERWKEIARLCAVVVGSIYESSDEGGYAKKWTPEISPNGCIEVFPTISGYYDVGSARMLAERLNALADALEEMKRGV